MGTMKRRARACAEVNVEIMRGDRHAALGRVVDWARDEVEAQNSDRGRPRRRASDLVALAREAMTA